MGDAEGMGLEDEARRSTRGLKGTREDEGQLNGSVDLPRCFRRVVESEDDRFADP